MVDFLDVIMKPINHLSRINKLTATLERENHMKAFEHSCMELGGVNLKQTLSAVSVSAVQSRIIEL